MSRNAIRIAAGSVTVAAWVFLGLSLRGGGTHVDAVPCEESGRLMAAQAMALVEPGGDITVIARDTSSFSNPASDIQLASFLKEVQKAHGVIAAIRKLQVDPLRPIGVPSSDFCDLIRGTPPGSVIVSFMGPPLLTDAERSLLGPIQPAILAFVSGRQPELVNMASLFQQGLLRAAIVDRAGPGGLFQTLTASNVAVLTAGQEGKSL